MSNDKTWLFTLFLIKNFKDNFKVKQLNQFHAKDKLSRWSIFILLFEKSFKSHDNVFTKFLVVDYEWFLFLTLMVYHFLLLDK